MHAKFVASSISDGASAAALLTCIDTSDRVPVRLGCAIACRGVRIVLTQRRLTPLGLRHERLATLHLTLSHQTLNRTLWHLTRAGGRCISPFPLGQRARHCRLLLQQLFQARRTVALVPIPFIVRHWLFSHGVSCLGSGQDARLRSRTSGLSLITNVRTFLREVLCEICSDCVCIIPL